MIINKFLSLLNRYKTDLPTFTIVGVGPGDPSLLTIAAVDAIKKAKVIVFPISDDNKTVSYTHLTLPTRTRV